MQKYLEVPATDTSAFLGVKHKKGDNHVYIENNVVNKLALGLKAIETQDISLHYSGGLRDYQRDDVIKMLSIPYILNANPMGLGKTVEAIIAMRELNVKNALIIVPKSIILQWKKMITFWWFEASERVKMNPKQVTASDIVIINYEKLLGSRLDYLYRSFQWDVLIADEAHRIKNRDAKRTKAIKLIPCARRWALTGTPILNKPDDLWSILHFLHESYSGYSYWNFVNKYCEVKEGYFGREIKGLTTDTSNIRSLNKLCELVAIRNSEVSVAHGKSINIVSLEIDTKQKTLYKRVKNLVFEELPETLTIPNGAVLTLRLQQVTSWPGLFETTEPGIKFEWISDLLEDNEELKIVIFSKFAKTVVALKDYLKVKTVTYMGSMNEQERAESLDSFITNKKTRAIMGTIGAMGQGIDGLQEVSHTMIFIDRDWSPELLKQAEDRLHRMGQNYPVNIYYLECDKTFDQHIGRVNITKTADIRRALSADNSL